jgi:hypothetical protein
MATAVFSETLDNFQHSTWLIAEIRGCTLRINNFCVLGTENGVYSLVFFDSESCKVLYLKVVEFLPYITETLHACYLNKGSDI